MKDRDDEKFMKRWGKERKRGKAGYMVYRTLVLALMLMLGSSIGRMLRGNPFSLDFYLFLVGAVGGAIGTAIAWTRDEARYLTLLEEEGLVERPDGPEDLK